jgi:hypothetical protein
MVGLVARRLRAGVTGAGLAIAFLTAVPLDGEAQPMAASALKAAFMLNFVKFAEWPARKPALPINLCVSGDDGIADALTRTVDGQTVDGRAIHVSRFASRDVVRDCQLLFVAERDPGRLAAILQEASESPVLTVSDVPKSATNGVMIEFFLEKDRLRFAVNIDAMERSQIKLGSRILSLAVIVRSKAAP